MIGIGRSQMKCPCRRIDQLAPIFPDTLRMERNQVLQQCFLFYKQALWSILQVACKHWLWKTHKWCRSLVQSLQALKLKCRIVWKSLCSVQCSSVPCKLSMRQSVVCLNFCQSFPRLGWYNSIRCRLDQQILVDPIELIVHTKPPQPFSQMPCKFTDYCSSQH